MRPLVSILIDNYNYGRFLRQAIDSALGQTYARVEVVVVDDGSTDESPEIIRSYGDKIRPVLKENGGQASAFNAGFAASQGEIIALLDADDYLLPHAVERIVARWTPGVNILYHRLRCVDDVGHVLGSSPALQDALANGDVVPLLLERASCVVPPTSGHAYSRSLLQRILPMPEPEFRIGADLFLMAVAPFLSPVTALDEHLAFYRIHGGNALGHFSRSRRHFPRHKLELELRQADLYFELVRKTAIEHGHVPATEKWNSSVLLFNRLLLERSKPGGDGRLTAPLVFQALRKLRTESWPLGVRVRLILLNLLVGLAPRAVLRHAYPGPFGE